MNRVSSLLATLSILLVPTLTHAQAFGGKAADGGAVGAFGRAADAAAPNTLMQALDQDVDGTISAAELRAAVRSLRKLDLNRDGQLTPDELAPWGAVPGMPPVGGDAAGVPGAAGGAVPGPGVAAGAAAGGAAAAGAAAGGAMPRGFGPMGGAGMPGGFGNAGGAQGFGGGAGMRVPGGGGLPLSTRQLMALDKDQDRRVSREELPADLWNLYGRFDVNNDGVLDLVEMRRAANVGR